MKKSDGMEALPWLGEILVIDIVNLKRMVNHFF